MNNKFNSSLMLSKKVSNQKSIKNLKIKNLTKQINKTKSSNNKNNRCIMKKKTQKRIINILKQKVFPDKNLKKNQSKNRINI